MRASGVNAYPLSWPRDRPRTPPHLRERSAFVVKQLGRARDELMAELKRMRATDVILSTDVPLKRDGLPYADGDPEDPGVAVYFTLKGKALCFACDRWRTVGENAWAIAKTVDAMRGIARWGTGEMVERAFTGFAALPPSPESDWRSFMDVHDARTLDEVRAKYRELARGAHPDVAGGSHDDMAKLNAAMEAAEKELGS